MSRDAVYLAHILEAIHRIENNTAEGREVFLDSHTLQDAVLRNLQTMAEATQRLGDEIKATQPDIDWRLIAAFRNVLVHDYLGIDLEQIWRTTQNDIQPLRNAATAMLDALEDQEAGPRSVSRAFRRR